MMDTQSHGDNRLRDFPVSFFAIVMGLSGLTIAAHKIESSWGGSLLSLTLLALTGGLFLFLAAIYLRKCWRHQDAVAAEWAHPVRISFFPTISISLILLAVAAYPYSAPASMALWSVGATAHMLMTVLVMTAWINHARYEVIHVNPAWFIPVVGNILVPIVGIHHAPADISWMFFAVGVLFWVVLLTIVMNRLIFHPSLPGKMAPTLFILLAPPSVGFISWVGLTGGVDAFGRILYFSAVFFFLLLTFQMNKFARQSFAMSWWAYSFPLAAFTLATLKMSEQTSSGFYLWMGRGLFVLLAAVIVGLALRTLVAVRRREICLPEH